MWLNLEKSVFSVVYKDYQGIDEECLLYNIYCKILNGIIQTILINVKIYSGPKGKKAVDEEVNNSTKFLLVSSQTIAVAQDVKH